MGNPPGPPDIGQPPAFVSVGDVAKQEIDPSNFGLLLSQGEQKAGWIERLAVAIWLALVKSLQAAISIVASLLDSLLAVLADFFLAAQAQNTPGFYQLTAALITDLTGIDIDGASLFSQFQQRGRIAAMQKVGGQIVDVLASEFAGVTQSDAGGVFTVGRGDGVGGLPAVPLTPEQGVNAARTFMGFAMSFAVREGNTDFFASLLPFGIGEGFKGYAEDLSKSLGLGRLTRLALRPLFQNLIGIPMTWALNKQYRPTLLGADLAVRAFNAGLFSAEQLVEELSRHGFSSERQNVLQSVHTKYPSERDLFLLELAGQIPADEQHTLLRRIGYNDDNIDLLIKTEPLHAKRELSLKLAENLVHQVLIGNIDGPTYASVLARFTLTQGEQQDFVGYVDELLAHPRKRLTFAQISAAFVDGIVSVDEVASYLHEEGYREDDIATLLQLDLFKLKEAQAKTAAAAAKKKKKQAGTPPGG
jgi:hypothetical protein